MPPRLWQRQPGETPADFTAFAAYLRLKGRRSHRATAEATGRPLGAIRRLSAQYNWPGRVAAFEARLADATQDALDAVIRVAVSASKSDLEQFRIKEFLLAHQVIHASHRWLELANNPRRHQISLTQICRLTELAFKLKCLATGLPFGDEPRRRKRREDSPGYWTGPTVEEALQKMYGAPLPGESSPSAPATPPSANSGLPSQPSGLGLPAATPSSAAAATPPSEVQTADSRIKPPDSGLISAGAATAGPCGPPPAPEPPRRDAWSRWARQARQQRS